MVEEALNALLDKEADELVNAGKYERSRERQGYRSGHYKRNFHTTGHKDRHVLYLTAPATLEIYTVDVDVGISAGKRPGTPLLYVSIGFFVEVAYRAG